jgi:glycosyltransferase involved in cell wall biosynthesis
MGGEAISAVVCTRNRCAYLRKCLAALQRQTLPSRRYEIVVVDNGSTDDTRAVVRSFCETNQNIRYLHEERPGLSVARNVGIRNSSADCIAFTDDDAEPDPTWLERMLVRFQEHSDDLGIVGGDVVPIWEADRPDWLNDQLLRPLSAGLGWSTEPRFLRAGEWLVEVNSGYRKRILLQLGGFPEHLGRVGDMLLSGEGGLNLLIERAGFRSFYDPSILVRHHVPAARLTKTWFRRRSFWQGVSLNLLNRYVEEKARRLGFPQPSTHTRTWEEVPVPISAAAWAELFDDGDGDEDFEYKLFRLEQLGYLLESQNIVIGRRS